MSTQNAGKILKTYDELSKKNLEHENSILKLEKLSRNEREMKTEENNSIQNVIESQLRIEEKETNSAKKEMERLEVSLLEMNTLKLSYYKQRKLFEDRETDLQHTIKFLKVKIDEINTTCSDIKSAAQIHYHKYTMYKKKVKYAIAVIKMLTRELKEKKAKIVHKSCQTEDVEEVLPNWYYDGSDHQWHHEVTLSNLFFKQIVPDSDSDVESIFFPSNKKYSASKTCSKHVKLGNK